ISLTLPDGRTYDFGGDYPGAHADLHILDVKAIQAFVQKGDIGFAESYRDGLWTSSDLSNLFLFGLQNEKVLDRYIYGSFLGRIASRFAYIFTRNTVKGSQKNIHAHYDLGNEFYRLWLDPSMTYSSAIYENDNDDLTRAQYRKYDRITERLSSSGRLLEVGCGWGGYADRALEKKDFGIKGITISQQQYDYAKDRLQSKADICLEDYRHQEGKYENIVSIEMFEAVGESFWPTYFSKLKSLLHERGKAIIQTITIDDSYFERYRKGGDMIRTYIFPGGMLPSWERFQEASQKVELKVSDKFAFGKDYAKTLEAWLERFDDKIEEVRALGFDQKFIRIWRFYLACCIASFKVERTNVMQIELQHAA
ncbi:MAG: cyclopropane-fatty-acyl-phospholipid synthase family protein, partial [Pseudomonadota bacterium]